MILYWLDIETTGLDPRRDKILELAIIPTTMDFETLRGLEPFVATFKANPSLRDLDAEVIEMHAKSGLWRDVKARGEDATAIYNRLREWLDDAQLKRHEGCLAGRSVHFDRTFITTQFPPDVFAKFKLSHRHFDLTPIKAFLLMSGLANEDYFKAFVSQAEHRALADIEADIRLAKKMVWDARRLVPPYSKSRGRWTMAQGPWS